MNAPAVPTCEPERLRALHDLGLLDTGREERFERFTRLARSLTRAPIATISLVDVNRQWFKGMQGLDVTETPRDVSFCGHAIHEQGVFYIPDARADARFAQNPLVTGPPHIRFYAGAPLTVPGAQVVGTLCVIDRIARQFASEQLRDIRDLADCLQRELATHMLVRRLDDGPLDTSVYTHAAYQTLRSPA